jgi:SAM-dependent methyltransferase
MLEEARRNVKNVEFLRGDMVNFDLGRRFDVVLCLFSAIGYVRTYPKLARTLRNLARHLTAGGVLIIEPWFTKSDWRAGTVHVVAPQGSRDLKVVRVDYSGVKGDMSVVDEMTVVAKRGEGITYYRERQLMGLFERDDFLRLMAKAGLRAKYLKTSLAPGRGLYVGTKGAT